MRGASWNRRRRAFSLLEVILAIAILGGSMAVLGELVRVGTRSASGRTDALARTVGLRILDGRDLGGNQPT